MRKLGIFQIGPVQTFIQTARKTSDYWSGSFLLSYFCALAIDALGEENIIFPNVEGNPLYKEVKGQNGTLPWPGGVPEKSFRPTLPNRLVCVFDDGQDCRSAFENCRTTIISQWEKCVDAIAEKLPAKVNENQIWKEIWDRQVSNPFEILYVWRIWDDTEEEYLKAYQKTESLMGARKASRWFDSTAGEPGHKCSLCGEREALHLSKTDGRTTRRNIRKDWKEHIRKKDLTYRFNETETLCAICMIKRMAPTEIFNRSSDVPSTGTIAVSSTVAQLIEFKDIVKQKADGFKEQVTELARSTGESALGAMMPQNAKRAGDAAFFNLDGNWLIEEYYRNLIPSNPLVANELESGTEKLKDLLTTIRESSLRGGQSYLAPSKYFAVIAVDGDDMGRLLGNLSMDQHRSVSQTLAAFSSDHVFKIFDRELAYIVYFGGDEGVVFSALDDLFSVMVKLRGEWETQIESVLARSISLPPPTMSAGAAVVHHKASLRTAIGQAHDALEQAKKLEFYDMNQGKLLAKDAFCISIDRRSGDLHSATARWTLPGDKNTLNVMETFKRAYRQEVLSPRWLGDLKSLGPAIGDPPENFEAGEKLIWLDEAMALCEHEIPRVIKRHTGENPSAKNATIKLSEEARKFYLALTSYGESGNRPFDAFCRLMDAAHYVAKGGGR